MPRPKNADPVHVFAAGKRGVATLYRALGNDDPAIQLAAARIAREAANRLPDAIEEELRAAGNTNRRALVRP